MTKGGDLEEVIWVYQNISPFVWKSGFGVWLKQPQNKPLSNGSLFKRNKNSTV